ncbi:hypothetical protein Tco_1098433, partial [Tanacetum coccineum]
KLGNGDSTSFWYDNWSGVGAAKDLYPQLFALENFKEINVSSKINDSCLNRSFRLATMVDVNTYVEWCTWLSSLRMASKSKAMLEVPFTGAILDVKPHSNGSIGLKTLI